MAKLGKYKFCASNTKFNRNLEERKACKQQRKLLATPAETARKMRVPHADVQIETMSEARHDWRSRRKLGQKFSE